MVLAGLLILSCGSLVSCQVRQEVPSDASVSASVSDPAPATDQETGRSVHTDVRTLRTASGRELTVALEEQKMEGEYLENWYQVTGIQVYDGEALIQTIDPASREWPQPASPDDGLYVMREHDYMEPQVLDLNADGSEDLGVMAELLPPKSPSFAWFLWDEDREQLVLSAWLSDFLITARQGTYSLSPDLEFYCNFYTYNQRRRDLGNDTGEAALPPSHPRRFPPLCLGRALPGDRGQGNFLRPGAPAHGLIPFVSSHPFRFICQRRPL